MEFKQYFKKRISNDGEEVIRCLKIPKDCCKKEKNHIIIDDTLQQFYGYIINRVKEKEQDKCIGNVVLMSKIFRRHLSNHNINRSLQGSVITCMKEKGMINVINRKKIELL